MKKRSIIAIVLFVPVVIAWIGFLVMQYDIRSVKKQILYALKEDSDNYDKITNDDVLGYHVYNCSKDKPIKYNLHYFYGFHNFSSGVVVYMYTKICIADAYGDETGSGFVPVLATIKKVDGKWIIDDIIEPV